MNGHKNRCGWYLRNYGLIHKWCNVCVYIPTLRSLLYCCLLVFIGHYRQAVTIQHRYLDRFRNAMEKKTITKYALTINTIMPPYHRTDKQNKLSTNRWIHQPVSCCIEVGLLSICVFVGLGTSFRIRCDDMRRGAEVIDVIFIEKRWRHLRMSSFLST